MQDPGVPIFKLYGEGLEWPTPDLLHCETIPARSRQHDWEIRPHRHPDLTQLLYLRQGSACIEIEGQLTGLDRPAVQLVPPLCIHGFHFSEQVDGQVLTLAAPLTDRLKQSLGELQGAFDRPGLYLAGADRAYLDTLFDALSREYAAPAPGREPVLQALVEVLAVWVGRQAIRQRPAAALAPGHQHLARFQQLVERHYRERLTLDTYAHQLGITTAHLNTLCRRFTGLSAQAVVHQRVLLEAKRELLYTALTASQIADRLGFSEPAYFSRFFKRLTGRTPQAFRTGR